MSGAMAHAEENGVAPKPRVRHGATIEGIVGRTAPLVRAARLRAGMPVALWPLIMACMLFNLGWWAASGSDYQCIIQGSWEPMPPGARVLYMPSNAADMRLKRDRYLGEARFGLMGGYATDMTPKRAYLILDEIALFKEGKLRIVTSEVVKLLADERGRIMYPCAAASGPT